MSNSTSTAVTSALDKATSTLSQVKSSLTPSLTPPTSTSIIPTTSLPTSPPSLPLLHSLLARYLNRLAIAPLKTKSTTAAVLFFLQEVLAVRWSGSRREVVGEEVGLLSGRRGVGRVLKELGVSTKALQMATYGALISAPLSHFFTGFFQRLFKNRTGLGARLGQIVLMQVIQSPITAVIYLSSMAVINGARSVGSIIKVVQMGLPNVLKSMWISSPIAIALAQTFLPPETWVVWFNMVSFVIGTYMTTQLKKRQLIMQAKAKAKKDSQ